MSGVSHTTPIAKNEFLSRYVFYSNCFRADNTVKPEAFIPHPYPDLSVTRHAGLAISEILQFGLDIAQKRNKVFLGRADIEAGVLHEITPPLKAIPTVPPPDNHVNITGWPEEKAEQKIIALQIAAQAKLIKYP